MWTILEVGIGMTAGSMASLRPLLRRLNITGLGSSDQRSGMSRGFHGKSGSYHQTHELGFMKQHNSNVQSTHVEASGLNQENNSQEMILEHGQSTIYKTVDVTISRSS